MSCVLWGKQIIKQQLWAIIFYSHNSSVCATVLNNTRTGNQFFAIMFILTTTAVRDVFILYTVLYKFKPTINKRTKCPLLKVGKSCQKWSIID